MRAAAALLVRHVTRDRGVRSERPARRLWRALPHHMGADMSAAILRPIRQAVKLRPAGICDFCDDAGVLFACMGESRCPFVHGCEVCLTRHCASVHPGESRFGVAEKAVPR